MLNQAFFTVKNISKSIGAKEILSNINLNIEKNQIFTVLGPSGSGKTTFLRIIAGFEQPTKGEIFLNGKNITKIPPQQRPIHTIFQSYALFPHMTVFENIRFPLLFSKIKESDQQRQVAEMLEIVDLKGCDHLYPHELSGGQNQRVAFARALIKKPKLLLMDEPFAALDYHLREKLQDNLLTMLKSIGITCIHITHNQSEALSLSTHIAVLGNKEIQQFGTVQEVYNHPRSVYVARFLGNMNIFSSTVVRKHADYSELQNAHDGVKFRVQSVDTDAGCDVCFGVRPESITITKTQTTAEFNALSAVVTGVFFHGKDTLYTVLADPHAPKISVVVSNKENVHFLENEQVWIKWDIHAAAQLQL
ncbi:MAG: ABC transporter ATP-binding protein [Alphaproteobacteria bacterium]|nr:ABC transporter ATP-binding protein [Alphaproteobacteria bacterium]